MSLLDKASLIQIPSGYKNGKLYSVKPNPSYGSEQISNGDFATNSDWTLTSSANITNGKLNVSAGAFDFFAIQTALVNGNFYKISIEVAVTSGSVLLYTGSQFATITSSGVYNYNFTSDSTQIRFRSSGSGFVGSIDNVSVKEVLNDGDFDFSRSSSATRVNSEGLIEVASVLGSELITNGDFATDSDWSLSPTAGTATISNGKLNFTNSSSSGSQVQQTSRNYVIGKTYKITLTVSDYVQGDVRLSVGNNITNYFDSNGTFTQYLTYASGLPRTYVYTDNSTLSIDNVSVKEVIENDVPRLDYSGGASCASLLLEPQTQNLVTYSEDFSQWSTLSANAATYVSDLVNPDGSVGGYKISGDGIYLAIGLLTTTQRSIYARSVSGSGNVQLLSHNSNGGLATFTITEEWQRFDSNSSPFIAANFYIDLRGASSTLSELYVWGAQATNDQSYVTSYIPSNSGSQTTRTADVCNNAGTSATFNDSEGVLFAEIAALSDDLTYRQISLTESSGGGDVLTLDYSSTSNQIRSYIRVNGTTQSLTHTLTDETQYNKIAIKYKDTHEIWVNGSKVASSSLTLLPIDINLLTFDNGAGNGDFYGKTKQLMVFDEALSDEELSDLTGQVNDSFVQLANFYNYTIL